MSSAEDLQYSLLQQEDGKLYLDFPRFVSGKHLTNIHIIQTFSICNLLYFYDKRYLCNCSRNSCNLIRQHKLKMGGILDCNDLLEIIN